MTLLEALNRNTEAGAKAIKEFWEWYFCENKPQQQPVAASPLAPEGGINGN